MGLFKVRRTVTPGLIPEGLTYGEMAVNLADRILYVGGTAENAIEILGGSGNYHFFYQANAPGLSQGYGTTGETGEYDHLIGSRWVDSDTGREFVYINDGDQWYWVEPKFGFVGGGQGADVAGPEGAVQFRSGDSLSGSVDLLFDDATNRLVLGSSTVIAFGDGTTQGTARNFYSLTGPTSSRFPLGVSGVGNTGDRLLIATGPSADPFRNYIRFGNQWFQTIAGGRDDGSQFTETTWGRTDPVTVTVGGVEAGTVFDVDAKAVEVLHMMLYPYQMPDFSSFSVNLGIASIVELGATSSAGTYASTWTASHTSNWVSNSISISEVSPSSSTLATGLSIGQSGVGVSHPTYRYTTPTSLQFRISGQELQGSTRNRNSSPTYNWRARIYYGKSPQESILSTYSSFTDFSNVFTGGVSQVFTPSNTSLQSGSPPSGTELQFVQTETAQYLWLFSPNVIPSFGLYNYFVEQQSPGFQQTPSLTGDVVITNSNGVSMNYVYYRWQFPTSGSPLFRVNVT